MRIFTVLLALSFTALFAVIPGSPVNAAKGVTPGYDLEFSEFLQSQGAKVKSCIVAVETRYTRTIHEKGKIREMWTGGRFATGFVYNNEGIVVTNSGVMFETEKDTEEDSSNEKPRQRQYIKVTLYDGKSYDAELLGTDGPTMLAVLKLKYINPEDSVPAKLGNSDNILIGEPILTVAFNANTKKYANYDFGIISALRPEYETIEDSTNQFIQVNYAYNIGYEGGVVVNSDGDVVAILTDVAPYADAKEVHFALPINRAVEVVDAIIGEGEFHRPWMGFNMLEMNPQIERAYSIISDMDGDGLVTDKDREMFKEKTGIDLAKCLFIVFANDDSPANDVGLREADILTQVNGVPVHDMNEYKNQMEKYRIGDKITLQWMRREYSVWDPYMGEVTIEYDGQREDEKEKEKEKTGMGTPTS